MVRALEVTAVRELGVKVKVKFPAVPVITKLVKVAKPLTAATVVVPLSVPVPDARVATTSTVDVVTVLPLASTMRITGCVPRGDPLVAPTGCVVIAAAVAIPAVGVIDCVALVRPVAANVKVYAVLAVPVIPTLVNVATPDTAVAVAVPTTVPPALTVIVTTSVLLTLLCCAS